MHAAPTLSIDGRGPEQLQQLIGRDRCNGCTAGQGSSCGGALDG